MIAFLPSQAILPYEVPQIASLRGVRRIANFKIAGYTSKGKLRTVQTETTRTIGGVREQVAITPELIAEPEVVHQRRLHCGGRSQDALVAPIYVAEPVGRQRGTGAAWAETRIPIMRVPCEQVGPAVEPVVETNTDLFGGIGATEVATEGSYRRQIRNHAVVLRLVHVLIVKKEKQLVLLKRAAEVKPRIAAGGKRSRI